MAWRDVYALGATDFSCAVSGFGQVLKSHPREKREREGAGGGVVGNLIFVTT